MNHAANAVAYDQRSTGSAAIAGEGGEVHFDLCL